MHLLRGEVLAYNYAQILADAVFTVENDLKTKTPEQAAKGARPIPMLLPCHPC
jgi:hypothetical protein